MGLDPRVTFTRESLATYFDAIGALRYTNHNQVWSSEDFTDPNWGKRNGATVTANATTAPDGTTTADRLNHNTVGTVTGGYVSQNVNEIPYRAIWSAYAKAGSKNFLILALSTADHEWASFNLSTGTVDEVRDSFISAGMENVGGGWYRCWGLVKYETGVITGTTLSLCVGETTGITSCTSPGHIFIWGAQFQWVTLEDVPGAYLRTVGGSHETGGPRFDHDPITHEPLGMLIEESRTNRATSSQHNTNTVWVRTNSHVDPDVIDAPDFGITADRMTAMASPATTSQTVNQSAFAYTVSVFAMRGTSDWVYLVGQSVDTPRAWFNLATGTVGTVQAGLTGATIQNIGAGWYRIAISDVGATGNENCTLGISDADNSTSVTIGKTIYLWGWQNEAGSFATSYIPCQVGPFQRDAEVATMTGTNFSSWYNAPAGTFVAEFDLSITSGTRPVVSADNNGVNERIFLYGSGTDPKVTITDGGATQADLDAGTFAAGLNKLGVSAAANDIAVCHNGGTVGTDTSASMPTPTQLRLGFDGTNYLSGHLRRVRFFNVAKSNAQLQVLTTIGALSGGMLAATEGADVAAGLYSFIGTMAATEGADVAAGVVDFLGLNLDFATTLDGRITFTRASSGTYFDSAGVLQTAATNGVRLDHDPVTHAAKGLLIEESRINSCTVSEDFTHANWVKTSVTVSGNQIAAPDGNTTADRITTTASPATVHEALGQGAGVNYVYSVFAKAGTCNWVYMVGQPVDLPRVWFNLSTGAVGTVGTGFTATGIQDVGNGWYRCWFADVGGTGAENLTIGLADADNSTAVTVGRTVHLWGGQNEAPGSSVARPTSYIPVPSTSGVTRSADTAVMTSTNFSAWYNASAGTFVATFDLLAASGTRGIISVDNATTGEQILLYGSGTDPKAKVRDGSVDQADLDVGTIAADTVHKLGISFALNDIAACCDGGTVSTDLAATMPTPTQLRLGYDGANYLNGHVRSVKFYVVAKSDAELAALTA